MEYESTLERSRNDKIRALGFVCYNLYVDGVIVFPEMKEIVESIRTTLNYLLILRQNNSSDEYLQMQELGLNERLTELGCICYNLYVDRKLFNSKVLSLCDSIFSINHEIAVGLNTFSHGGYNNNQAYPYENQEQPEARPKHVTHSKLKVTCPYGMEPIPSNYKKCACGYRNRPEARYCGRCGAKLS